LLHALSSDNAEAQLEGMWCITNIAAGEHEEAQATETEGDKVGC